MNMFKQEVDRPRDYRIVERDYEYYIEQWKNDAGIFGRTQRYEWKLGEVYFTLRDAKQRVRELRARDARYANGSIVHEV